MKILSADPAKNITVFILEEVEGAEERAALVRVILADRGLGAEQVGFVVPPAPGGRGLWHLEMAGGEFCGNAARSFGLYTARELGLKGKAVVEVSVSGAGKPLRVKLEVEEGRAAAEMPLPRGVGTLFCGGRVFSAFLFEGITHVIAPDTECTAETFHAFREAAEQQLPAFAALGVMFYDTASGFTRPAVYVPAASSLVFESSCGSGSAALGAWLSRETRDGEACYTISQPGGVIETEVLRKAGEIERLVIGGKVTLAGPFEYPWPSVSRRSRGCSGS